MAALWPPGPEPMTIRSYGCIQGVLYFLFRVFRGTRGGGDFLFPSIGHVGRTFLGLSRTVNSRVSQRHQMLLDGKSPAPGAARGPRVQTIGSENPGFAIVGQISGK